MNQLWLLRRGELSEVAAGERIHLEFVATLAISGCERSVHPSLLDLALAFPPDSLVAGVVRDCFLGGTSLHACPFNLIIFVNTYVPPGISNNLYWRARRGM